MSTSRPLVYDFENYIYREAPFVDKISERSIMVIAQGVLGSQRAVTVSGEYAGIKPAIGFTVQAVEAGSEVPVLTSGELNGFAGLTQGEPIYLNENGLVSHVPSVVGLHQILGYAKSSSEIIIQIQQAVRL